MAELPRSVLITGAASGLGQALAERMAKTAQRLILWDVNEVGLVGTAHRCAPCPCVTTRMDMTDSGAVAAAFAELAAKDALPDFIFHGAGVLVTGGLDALQVEDCQRMINVNYLGTVNLLLNAAKHMRSGGEVFCVSSVAGLKGLPEFAAYCASKFAVFGFCEAIADDFAQRGLHLSVICPPAVDTPMVRNLVDRPVLYDVFSFAEKDVVIDRIVGNMGVKKEFIILIDFQTKALRKINGLFPELTSMVFSQAVKYGKKKKKEKADDQR